MSSGMFSLKGVGESVSTGAFLCALGAALWLQSDYPWWGVFLTVFGGLLFLKKKME